MMTWPYIAGFFDGEGSISLPRGRSQRIGQITIVQSEKNGGGILFEEIRSFLEERGIYSKIHYSPRSEKAPCAMFVLGIRQERSIEKFLNHVMPYLRVKRTTAQDTLRYRKLYPNLKSLGMHTGFDTRRGVKHPWVTKALKGNHDHGGNKKLTIEQAKQILSLKGTGIFQKDVAKRFGVSRSNIELIWMGKRWNFN